MRDELFDFDLVASLHVGLSTDRKVRHFQRPKTLGLRETSQRAIHLVPLENACL